jgi:hypothetical protein
MRYLLHEFIDSIQYDRDHHNRSVARNNHIKYTKAYILIVSQLYRSTTFSSIYRSFYYYYNDGLSIMNLPDRLSRKH